MRSLHAVLLPILLCAVPLIASADSWKDEGGHGRGHGHGKHKEEYWDGNCKVERKFGKDGEYKEKRKCRAPEREYYQPVPVYVPAPPVQREPGIILNGTIRIP
jgi:hypothetical protein